MGRDRDSGYTPNLHSEDGEEAGEPEESPSQAPTEAVGPEDIRDPGTLPSTGTHEDDKEYSSGTGPDHQTNSVIPSEVAQRRTKADVPCR